MKKRQEDWLKSEQAYILATKKIIEEEISNLNKDMDTRYKNYMPLNTKDENLCDFDKRQGRYRDLHQKIERKVSGMLSDRNNHSAKKRLEIRQLTTMQEEILRQQKAEESYPLLVRVMSKMNQEKEINGKGKALILAGLCVEDYQNKVKSRKTKINKTLYWIRCIIEYIGYYGSMAMYNITRLLIERKITVKNLNLKPTKEIRGACSIITVIFSIILLAECLIKIYSGENMRAAERMQLKLQSINYVFRTLTGISILVQTYKALFSSPISFFSTFQGYNPAAILFSTVSLVIECFADYRRYQDERDEIMAKLTFLSEKESAAKNLLNDQKKQNRVCFNTVMASYVFMFLSNALMISAIFIPALSIASTAIMVAALIAYIAVRYIVQPHVYDKKNTALKGAIIEHEKTLHAQGPTDDPLARISLSST